VPEPADVEPDPASGPEAGTMVFRLTTAQGRRRRIGLMGGAAIVWTLGLVRYVVTGRVSGDRWVLPLVLLAAVLALGAAAAGGHGPGGGRRRRCPGLPLRAPARHHRAG
jgi:hypothetical protein